MIVVYLLSIISAILAYLAKEVRYRYMLKISFVFVFLFLALRYAYGNDYMSYFDTFNAINQENKVDFYNFKALGGSSMLEPGWVFLCWLFKPFGFFIMVAVLALFNCYAYYHLVSKYVPQKYYWFSIFIYIINPIFMLIQLSAMRQAVAIGIFLISIDFLIKKDIVKYIILIIVASLFHSSALLMLPLVIISIYDINYNKFIFLFSIFVYVFAAFTGNLFLPYIDIAVNNYFPKYSSYADPGKFGSGLGVLYGFIVLALVLYFIKYEKSDYSVLYKVLILSIIIMPLSIYINMLGRMQMYLQPIALVVYPLVFLKINNAFIRNIFICMIVAFAIRSVFVFIESDVWGSYYLEYNTIINAL